MDKKTYWQLIWGICILAVVLIYTLGRYDYSDGAVDIIYLILRQFINFAVATFIFMLCYFVNIGKIEWEIWFILIITIRFTVVLIGQKCMGKKMLKRIGFV